MRNRNTTILFLTMAAILVVGGCQNTETQNAQNTGAANTASTPATASKPAASPTARPALPASNLKPEEIDLKKPVPAEELRNAVFGDEAAWKGKEVAVIGEYNGHSTSKLESGDKYSLNVQIGPQNVVINCDGRTAPPQDLKDRRTDRVFKGTVHSINKAWQQLTLEPCEVVN